MFIATFFVVAYAQIQIVNVYHGATASVQRARGSLLAAIFLGQYGGSLILLFYMFIAKVSYKIKTGRSR